jgi:cysteine desulfurase / selenocysteine lyase
MDTIHQHETKLGSYLYDKLQSVPGLKLYGPRPGYIYRGKPVERTGLVAFNHVSIHPTDLSFFLDQEGVAVRTGEM